MMKRCLAWCAGLLFVVSPLLALAAPAAGSLAQVFKKVGGAVVVVRTTGRAAVRDMNGRAVSIAGIGSGVLVSADGKVVTAAHVIQTAESVVVEFPNEVAVGATVIASDPAADVALLQLERVPAGAVTARLGNSDAMDVGEQVFVVGAPFGISHTLTVGHLSARRRLNTTFGDMTTTELFQTDAAINQGNSGGPMFNMTGEVIGVVSHIVSRSGGSEGLGFVVTSNTARRLLFEERSVWSGVEGYLLAGELARTLNVPGAGPGLLVQQVAAGSPAERLGVRGGTLPVVIGDEQLVLGGDIILAVQGIRLGAPNAYEAIRQRLIDTRARGGAIALTVLRGGAIVELAGSPPPLARIAR